MVLSASARWTTVWRWLRLASMATVALLVSHEAVYHARFGFGPRMSAAMTAGGHDAYWRLFTALALGAGAGLALAAAVRLARLVCRLRRLERPARSVPRRPTVQASYRGELLRLWPQLFAVVALAFIGQENLEAQSIGASLPGLAVLVGPSAIMAIAILALVTFVVAGTGSLVRWRIDIVEARIAQAATTKGPHRSRSESFPASWAITAALCTHRRILDRRDAGRAPPLALA